MLEIDCPAHQHEQKICSSFAALKADGSITAWGDSRYGGADTPSGSDDGGIGAPSGNGYTKIYSTEDAFAALKADGSITAWGV
jgi:hypothetical protein